MKATIRKPIELLPLDSISIILSTYKVKHLINRRDKLLEFIGNCDVTSEAEMLVDEHNDTLLALVKLN